MLTKFRLSILSILTFILLFFSIFFFSVHAQLYGSCVRTRDGHYCQQWVSEYDCLQGFYPGKALSEIPECKLGTCLTKDGSCKFNVPYATCTYEMLGTFYQQRLPDECNKGCCGIAGRYYGIVSKARCKELAIEEGFPLSYVDFTAGLVNEEQCVAKFSQEERGCCVISEGNCVYTTRASCSAQFYPLYCSAVPQCHTQARFYKACERLDNGEISNRICFYDSAGNLEQCIETCNWPMQYCDEHYMTQEEAEEVCEEINLFNQDTPSELKMNEWIDKGLITLSQKNICVRQHDKEKCGDKNCSSRKDCLYYKCLATQRGKKTARCVNANCNELNLIYQNITWQKGNLKIEPLQLDSIANTFSHCYNFWQVDPSLKPKDLSLKGKVNKVSKRNALKVNKKLNEEFNLKDKNWEDLTNSKKQNFVRWMGGRSTGLENMVLLCYKGKLWVHKLGPEREKICEQVGPSASIRDNKWKACMEYNIPNQTGWWNNIAGWIGNAFAGGDALMPGLATLLKALGRFPTKQGCLLAGGSLVESESDCVFRAELSSTGLGTKPLGPACLPRYPPGTQAGCLSCGKSNLLFDRCKQSECLALGNCQFKQDPVIVKLTRSYLTYYAISKETKFNLIPWYTAFDGAVCALTNHCRGKYIPCKAYPTWQARVGCVVTTYPREFAAEVGEVAGQDIKNIMDSIGFVKNLGKDIINGVVNGFAGQLSSKVLSKIKI